MTMSETKHTPTPWQVKHPDHEPWYVIGNIDGPDYGRGYYETICDCDQDSRSSMDLEVAKANAAFIVEAVNNHERLTQRVQELEKALKSAASTAHYRGVLRGALDFCHGSFDECTNCACWKTILAGAQKEATK
jgi:hypothetical protein